MGKYPNLKFQETGHFETWILRIMKENVDEIQILLLEICIPSNSVGSEKFQRRCDINTCDKLVEMLMFT